MVSYMCQSQLSSDMLPSDAPMPPCAATVCERVGEHLGQHRDGRPASASCSEQRMPAPPAPTMIASNFADGKHDAQAPIPLGRARRVQPAYAIRSTITAT